MKPQAQLHPNGCLQACIATILDFDINEVPDFTAAPDDGTNKFPVWWIELQHWLRKQGMFFLEMRIAGTVDLPNPEAKNGFDVPPIKKDIFTVWNPLPWPTLAFFCGPAAKTGRHHVVIGTCEDDKFLPQFDPIGPNAPGLQKIHSVCFIVPIDPGAFVRMGRAMENIEKLATSRAADDVVRDSIRGIAREALGKPVLEEGIIQLNGRHPSK